MKRSLATCIILSILTCGLYGLYWLYKMADDFHELNPDMASGGTVLLLSIVTCGIYGWFWIYKAGQTIDDIRASKGLAPGSKSILCLVLAVLGLGLISYCILQDDLNSIAE